MLTIPTQLTLTTLTKSSHRQTIKHQPQFPQSSSSKRHKQVRLNEDGSNVLNPNHLAAKIACVRTLVQDTTIITTTQQEFSNLILILSGHDSLRSLQILTRGQPLSNRLPRPTFQPVSLPRHLLWKNFRLRADLPQTLPYNRVRAEAASHQGLFPGSLLVA